MRVPVKNNRQQIKRGIERGAQDWTQGPRVECEVPRGESESEGERERGESEGERERLACELRVGSRG